MRSKNTEYSNRFEFAKDVYWKSLLAFFLQKKKPQSDNVENQTFKLDWIRRAWVAPRRPDFQDALRCDQIWSSSFIFVGCFLKLHSSPTFLACFSKNPKKSPKSGPKPAISILLLTRQIRFSCDFFGKVKIGPRDNTISITRLAGANTIRVISRICVTSDGPGAMGLKPTLVSKSAKQLGGE